MVTIGKDNGIGDMFIAECLDKNGQAVTVKTWSNCIGGAAQVIEICGYQILKIS